MADVNTVSKNFEGINVDKIFRSETCETIVIHLEATHTLPKHTTTKEALLFVHQGEIMFKINNEQLIFRTGDTYKIPPNIEHSVDANVNSIFLIVR